MLYIICLEIIKEDGLFYLNKIKEDEFNSFRVSEILLYNFINNKEFFSCGKNS